MSTITTDGFGTIFSVGATPSNPNGGAYGGSGSGNTVTWAPSEEDNPDPLPSGWYREFSDAVAAIVALTAPETILQIMANPDNTDVQIPGGTWQLNNTLISGVAINADTDTDFRGEQELLDVETEGNSSNRCKLLGCRGLKDMYFRSQEGGTDTSTTADFTMPAAYSNVDITTTDTTGFEVDKLLYINSAGYMRIISINESNVTVQNANFSGNTSPTTLITSGQNVWPDDAVFYRNTSYTESDTAFVLDNVDFHFGNYRFGTFHADQSGNLTVYLMNGAATRWYAFRIDDYAVFETDGSGCWIGTNAFAGDGYVDVFPMAGCQVRPDQGAINGWQIHQPYITYIPNSTGNWNTIRGNDDVPSAHHEALDVLVRVADYMSRPGHLHTTISAPQTTTLATGDHVVFNAVITEDYGHQQRFGLNAGRITLLYSDGFPHYPRVRLSANMGSFDGVLVYQWWDITNNVGLGNICGNAGGGTGGNVVAMVPENYSETDVTVELRLVFALATTFIGENTAGGFMMPWALVETFGGI